MQPSSCFAKHSRFWRTVLLTMFAAVACGGKKPPIPQGWFLGGQPLASTHNEVLAAGTTLHLPEKFTLEAATDSIVHVTQQPDGETRVHLLVGTAVMRRIDAQFPVALLANGNIVRLTGTRLLVQNQVGSTRILLLDGSAVIDHEKQKWELSVKADNLFEMKGTTRAVKKLAAREIDRLFPEVGRHRLLLAVR